MLIHTPRHSFLQNLRLLVLLAVAVGLSNTASAIIIEGTIKGVINRTYVEGTKPDAAFFKHMDEGQTISADFWYEYDEHNFPPYSSTGQTREYEFDLLNLGIVFHIGDENYTPAISSRDLPLTQYRNLIGIVRTPYFSNFDLLSFTTRYQDFVNFEQLGAEITFNDLAMSYFNDFDLTQNLSLKSDIGSPFGSAQVLVFGSVGDQYGIGQYYDATIYAAFNEFTIGARKPAAVGEPAPVALITVALLMLGWRYRTKTY